MEIRNRDTGEITTKYDFLQMNPGLDLPATWTQETLDAIGYDMIHPWAPTELPSSSLKEWVRDGVALMDDKWVWKYREVDIYDTPAKEAEHLAREEKALAEGARRRRDDQLRTSDWIVIKAQEEGSTIPETWKTYRQALRDVPSQEEFPRNITWPDVPS